MSSRSFSKIDQKEYLKKYLSRDKVKKKKKDKKRKHKSSSSTVKVKIIDDDVNTLDTGPLIDEELLLTGDDAPQIVGEYIEERQSDKLPKWKSIVKDEPYDERMADSKRDLDLWGRKASDRQELATGKKHSNRSPRDSSPRRKYRKGILSPSPSRSDRNLPAYSRQRKPTKSPVRTHKIKEEPQAAFSRKQKPYSARALYDYSPPRRGSYLVQSPPRRVQCSNDKRSPDQSPPRHSRVTEQASSRRRKSPDYLPPLQGKHLHQSPPRNRRTNCDLSPPRRQKYEKDLYDNSPSRNRRNLVRSSSRKDRRRNSQQSSDDASTFRRRDRHQTPTRIYNYSPQRSRRQKTPDHFPTRKNDKTIDQSPPRRRRDSDQSPHRRRRNSDQSPLRKGRNTPFESRRRSPGQSPQRRQRNNPFATRVKQEKFSPELSPRHSRWQLRKWDKSLSPPPTHKPKPGKTLEGKKAGLQDAQSLHKETMERRKQEDLLFEKMSSEVSGRNAEVQVRSTGRKGRRAREALDEDPEERRRKEEHEEQKKLLYDRWGKGLKQIEDHKNRMLELEHESSKPFARYSNDEDLERHLKEQERADDPMRDYMRQKRKEKEKKSGKAEIPRYEGPYPENRFGIPPGHRWDGVDRSNGFEKKYFAVQNEKRARQDEAYKYSVEDM